MRTAVRSAAVAALIVFGSSPAVAQGAFDMGLLTQTLSIDGATQEEKDRAAAPSVASINQGLASALSAPAAPTTADLRALSYMPTLARRAANFESFVAKTRARDPASADQLQRVLASGRTMADIQASVQPLDLQITNTADAYAIWWINAWDVANGRDTAVSREMAQAVRSQAAQLLLNSSIATASDATKQNLAEVFLVQAAILGAANEESGQDARARARLAKSVRDGAREIDIDLLSMELTPNGFVPRRGADASGSVKRGDREMAENPEGKPARPLELADYAVPALGGAAALAAVFFLARSAGRRG